MSVFIYLNTDSVQESPLSLVLKNWYWMWKASLISPERWSMLRKSTHNHLLSISHLISHVILTDFPHCRSDVTVQYQLCLDSQMFWLSLSPWGQIQESSKGHSGRFKDTLQPLWTTVGSFVKNATAIFSKALSLQLCSTDGSYLVS